MKAVMSMVASSCEAEIERAVCRAVRDETGLSVRCDVSRDMDTGATVFGLVPQRRGFAAVNVTVTRRELREILTFDHLATVVAERARVALGIRNIGNVWRGPSVVRSSRDGKLRFWT